MVNEYEDAPIKKVPLDSLWATHPLIDKEHLARLDADDDGGAAVVRWNGCNFIVDGHHHLSARWLRKKKKAKVKFIDMDQGIDPKTGQLRDGHEEAKLEELHKVDEKKHKRHIGNVMHRWKAGHLHSGSKDGPIVSDQAQAVAIALNSINKCVSPLFKFNPNHDDKGRFTSGDDANAGGGGTKGGGNKIRAVGEAAGSVAGTYGGQALGGLAAGALFGPEAAPIGAKVGGFLGGFAGDSVGRRIAMSLYASQHPGFQQPEATLGEDLGASLGAQGGYMAANAIVQRAIPELTTAEAVGRVIGSAAGDISGTRFGNYAQQRIGGVLAETKGHLLARYASDTAGDAAIDATTKVPFGKSDPIRRGRIDGTAPPAVIAPTRPRVFPARVRDDINIRGHGEEDWAVNGRFLNLLLNRETKQRSAVARLAAYGRRPETFQPQPGQSKDAWRQQLDQALATQQLGAFPWKQSVAKPATLFGEKK